MLFNSFNFWLVFPVVFVVYWLIPSSLNKVRNSWLLLVSYLLYMNWKPSFAIVLICVIIITFCGGWLLDKEISRRNTLCATFATLGLLPLLVFKYYNFLNESVTAILNDFGLHFSLPGLNWAIPIGISFFTFQAVGYLLDVYHHRIPAEKDFLDYSLFISFFPQVTSGPISTGKNLLPQIKQPHIFKYKQGRDGLMILLWGMFVKLALADRIGIYVDTVYSNYIHYSGAVCFFASLMYSIQIYCDFAGYSFMAIGIAQTLGFDLINNFERPYFAASVTEFWRRWHISLTKWLTIHVYIAMGGNRCSKVRQYWNILVTFLVSGIWHGANWTYVIWGVLHGLFQIIEKACMGEKIKSEIKGEMRIRMTSFRFVRILITFLLVSFAWIFFRMPSIPDALSFIDKIFTGFGKFSIDPLDMISMISLGICLPLLIFKDIYDEYFTHRINSRILKWIFYIVIAIYTITLGVLDSGQFIYVNF